MIDNTLEIAERLAESFRRNSSVTDVRVVRVSGHVGGTENRPEQWAAHAVAYIRDGEPAYVLLCGDIRDPRRALYVIDGGGFYVAGWPSQSTPGEGHVLLHSISRVRHWITGEVSDFDLLPRNRAYVLWTAEL